MELIGSNQIKYVNPLVIVQERVGSEQYFKSLGGGATVQSNKNRKYSWLTSNDIARGLKRFG